MIYHDIQSKPVETSTFQPTEAPSPTPTAESGPTDEEWRVVADRLCGDTGFCFYNAPVMIREWNGTKNIPLTEENYDQMLRYWEQLMLTDIDGVVYEKDGQTWHTGASEIVHGYQAGGFNFIRDQQGKLRPITIDADGNPVVEVISDNGKYLFYTGPVDKAIDSYEEMMKSTSRSQDGPQVMRPEITILKPGQPLIDPDSLTREAETGILFSHQMTMADATAKLRQDRGPKAKKGST